MFIFNLQHTIFVQHANAANFSKEGQRRLFDNVLAFCALWIRSIPYDFRGQPMRDRLLAVLSLSGTQKDTVAQRLCDDLLTELRMALGRLERYEGAIRSLEPQLERNWEKRWEGPGGLMATGRTPIQIAQQLAHIELVGFGSNIHLNDIFICFFNTLQKCPPGTSFNGWPR